MGDGLLKEANFQKVGAMTGQAYPYKRWAAQKLRPTLYPWDMTAQSWPPLRLHPLKGLMTQQTILTLQDSRPGLMTTTQLPRKAESANPLEHGVSSHRSPHPTPALQSHPLTRTAPRPPHSPTLPHAVQHV